MAGTNINGIFNRTIRIVKQRTKETGFHQNGPQQEFCFRLNS